MAAAVSGFFTWIAANLPDFLLSHPVIDILAIAVGICVITLVFRLIRLRA